MVLFLSHYRMTIRNMVIHSYREDNTSSRKGSGKMSKYNWKAQGKTWSEKIHLEKRQIRQIEGCNRSIKILMSLKEMDWELWLCYSHKTRTSRWPAKLKGVKFSTRLKHYFLTSFVTRLCHRKQPRTLQNSSTSYEYTSRIHKILITTVAGLNMPTAK